MPNQIIIVSIFSNEFQSIGINKIISQKFLSINKTFFLAKFLHFNSAKIERVYSDSLSARTDSFELATQVVRSISTPPFCFSAFWK
jgi:hypothetical protein